MAMTTINTRTHRPGLTAQRELNILKTRLNGAAADGLAALADQLAAITAVIDSYEQQAAEIVGLGHLTASGQQVELQKLRDARQKKLAEVTGETAAGYARHLRDLQAKFWEPDPDTTDAARLRMELRAQAIRAHAVTLQGYDLELWYRRANPEQQRALEHSPVQMLRDDLQAEVKAERLARLMPELSSEIQTLQALSDSFAEVVSAAQQHLGVMPERVITYGPHSQPLG
jgi:hypothetical protein